jgi:alkaline phosphatase D
MAADQEYPEVTATTIAFGSCHKNKLVKPNQPKIWDAISDLKPDAFLWTGDTVYSPVKAGISPVEILKHEYDDLLNNSTIGYSDFLSNAMMKGYLEGGVHGTWDDHDFGANDYGEKMPQKEERQNLLFDFLGVTSKERRSRDGVYNSITFGMAPRKVKVIFLDTRSARQNHCIPSVGAVQIPFGLGSAIGCLTRWLSCGLKLNNMFKRCRNGKMLDEAQWEWFENQLESDAQINLIVSSVQVLTTNPAMESWGQFPMERERLLKLLNSSTEGNSKQLALLSGDVHHGEISDSSRRWNLRSNDFGGQIIEVTSSGLTHSCTDPFYGGLCAPVLDKFPKHRYEGKTVSGENYYTGKNFGSIHIDWGQADKSDDDTMTINVHDNLGNVVLSTGVLPLTKYSSHLSDAQIPSILSPIDGHLIPFMARATFGLVVLVSSLLIRRKFAKIILKERLKMKAI